MVDPLAEVVALLQPSAPFSKLVVAAGRWRVRRTEAGRAFYCVVLEGASALAVEGDAPIRLEAGDFVLVPSAVHFTASSVEAPDGTGDTEYLVGPDGEIRHGELQASPDVRMLVGYCAFTSPDARLLVSLLPHVVHVRDDARLTSLVELVRDESRARRPARDVILARLLEVLLIEALRATGGATAAPGLVRGLADTRVAAALRGMHERPAAQWTVAALAREAGMSRSSFFDRFSAAVGVAPMGYLLAWRMALAKELMRRDPTLTIAEVATRVGYSSASTFSVAFSRHVGQPPTHHRARESRTRGASPFS